MRRSVMNMLRVTAILCTVFLCPFYLQTLQSQTCQPDCLAQTDVFVDSACAVSVSPSDLLSPINSCSGPFTLILIDCYGDTIPGNTITGQPHGAMVSAYVKDIATGANCSTSVQVYDTVSPVITCFPTLNVQLGPTGIGMRFATSFEHTSSDNCSAIILQAHRANDPFTPTVSFSCADIGTPVLVTTRVLQANDTTKTASCNTLVNVVDNWYPYFTQCPANLTVHCDYDYTNTTYTGLALAADNCTLDTVIHQVDNQVSGCGTGIYKNVFIAVDHKGLKDTCTQTISVINPTPFNQTHITWPSDYTLNLCSNSQLHPDSLPAPYNRPVLQQVWCAMPGTSWSDEKITYGSSGCHTIVRTWVVYDWCQHNPSIPGSGGRWEKKQFLYIQDPVAPMLTVPADITATVGSNCQTGWVNLPLATGTDNCSAVTVTNNSPYANASGANASGYYPVGTTQIAFRAQDECGNLMQKEVLITVKDLTPPTAICKNGLSINLSPDEFGYTAEVPALLFNQASYDHCTSTANLKMGIKVAGSNDAPTPKLVYDCSQLGTNHVELWVTDEKGNSGYCLTYILVQDNLQMCTNTTVSLKGIIETQKAERVEDVEVLLESTKSFNPIVTNTTGSFTFSYLPMQQDYTIMPARTGDWLNGVNVLDVLKIQRFILGLELFTTPYQHIAADLNGSKTVTSSDVVELRKLILGAYQSLPYAPSWQFVDQKYQFPSGNPLAAAWPAEIQYQRLACDTTAVFMAVKVGDVNGSAVASSATSSERTASVWALRTETKTLADGNVLMSVLPKAQQKITGLQMELLIAESEVLDIRPGLLQLADYQVFGAFGKSGTLRIAYDHVSGLQAEADQPLFSLILKKGGSVALSTDFAAMAFDEALEPVELLLEQGEPLAQIATPGATATPNPFISNTQIEILGASAQTVDWTLTSADGRVHAAAQTWIEQGHGVIPVSGAGLVPGYYYLHVQMQNEVRRIKLVKI